LSLAVVVLTLVLLAAVIAVISRPLLSGRTPTPTRTPLGTNPDGSALEDPPKAHTEGGRAGGSVALDALRSEELEAARESKYREIRDAELDYRTGKLSIEDYEAVNGALRAEAVEILDRLEALEERSRARETEGSRARETEGGSSQERPADSSTRVS
jgi:hypothetical protein